MTKRISPFTEKRIIELWFKGISRDVIAHQVGVSGSTVSEVVGLLPESLKDLRNLSKELRKGGLSPAEAMQGAKLVSHLAQLGTGVDELESFIVTEKKLAERADFTPKKVVQAAMTLSNLESESGKTYPEVLQDFTVKARRNEKLKKANRQLEKQRKQRLAQNKITESEIAYNVRLRQDFQAYGIHLDNAERLQQYIENMRETHCDPKQFIKYTEKFGSLERRLHWLESQERLKEEVISTQEDKISHLSSIIARFQDESLTLEGQIGEQKQTNESLQRRNNELRDGIQQQLQLLSGLFEVETEGKTIKEALDSWREKLGNLKTKALEDDQHLQVIQKDVQEAEIKNRTLETEIAEKLKIKDYSEEKQAAIKELEDRETSLEKETKRKRERLALADTVTNFLTRQPPYDFNIFYTLVQNIKTAREQPLSFYPQSVPILEEKVRMLALKVFEGDLVSKRQYSDLMQKYEDSQGAHCELESRFSELEAKSEETTSNLEGAKRENQLLKALRMNFEGHSTTLDELKNWTLSSFNEEIERRANEKFNAIAAGTYGALDFVTRKIARRFSNKQSEQQ